MYCSSPGSNIQSTVSKHGNEPYYHSGHYQLTSNTAKVQVKNLFPLKAISRIYEALLQPLICFNCHYLYYRGVMYQVYEFEIPSWSKQQMPSHTTKQQIQQIFDRNLDYHSYILEFELVWNSFHAATLKRKKIYSRLQKSCNKHTPCQKS